MAHRVILDSTSMRVSKPGIDVTSATENQLTFNSQWAMLSLLQTGEFVSSTPNTSPGGSPTTDTIMFNRTYIRRPIIFFATRFHTSAIPGWTYHVGPCIYWTDSSCYVQYYYTIQVKTDRFEFRNYVYRQCSGNWEARNYDVKYYIWDHDL